MQTHQIQQSYVNRIDNQFVNEDKSKFQNPGTKFIELHNSNGGHKIVSGTFKGNQWLLPIFNVFRIKQNIFGNGRTGDKIFIHRVEVSYTVKEDPGNLIGPDETPIANTLGNKIITDPRMRILIITPKYSYRYIPWSSSVDFQDGLPVYPYFHPFGDGGHPEPLKVPVNTSFETNFGMQSLPDPKKYDVIYDDIRNLRLGTQIGNDSGSFSFQIQREYTFNQYEFDENNRLPFNNDDLYKLIPQIWFFLPGQIKAVGIFGWSIPAWNFEWNVRMIFDDL